jgi:succinoglycan biosynthesis protein ExoV
VRQTDFFRQIKDSPKKYKVSLMPHFRSVKLFNWEKLCKKLGWHYISPCCGVENIEQTLREIAESEKIISEAMHGAILADIFRVPWARFVYNTYYAERTDISEFKWNDWLYSIGLFGLNSINIAIRNDVIFRYLRKFTNNILGNIPIRQVIKKIESFKEFYLSSDKIINIIDNKIVEQIKILKDK